MRSIASSGGIQERTHLVVREPKRFLPTAGKNNNNNLLHSSPANGRTDEGNGKLSTSRCCCTPLSAASAEMLSRWFSLSLFSLPMGLFIIFSIVLRQVERIYYRCQRIPIHTQHTQSLNWLIFYSLVRFLFRNCFHVQWLLFICDFLRSQVAISRVLFLQMRFAYIIVCTNTQHTRDGGGNVRRRWFVKFLRIS